VETLDIAGDAALSCAAGPCNVYNRIYCAGNWSSSSAWAPVNDMYVVLDGAGSFSISGTDPRFPRLLIDAGTRTLQSAAQVKHALTISTGASLVCSAALDAIGSVTLGGATATWDLGSLTHTVGTSYTSTGGNAIGTGWIECDGTGAVVTGTGSIANLRVNTSGTVTLATARVSGDLELIAGTLLVADDVTASVGGDARLLAPGIFGFGPATTGPETLDIAGDVSITALTGGSSTENRVRCGGNWSGDGAWSPTLGLVYLYGASAHDIGGAAPSFPNLIAEAGSTTLRTNAVVKGGLWVLSGATLLSAASFDIAGNVTLGDATSSWDLGGLTHTVGTSYTSTGGSAIGTGWIECDGTGAVATGAGSIANLRVNTSGTVTLSTSRVSGDLELLAGTMAIGGGATVTVEGDARLSGGTLSWETASIVVETMDIAGDATLSCAAGPCNVYNRLYCAGNWSSTSAWAPVSDMYVVLDGEGNFSISGTDPRFPRLAIAEGTYTLQSTANVKHALTILDGATLVCDAALDVDGNVGLGDATSAWDLGSFTHTIGTSYASTGGNAVGTGWIQCDGTGTVTTATGSIANLRVSTSGTVTLGSALITGDLELSSGTLAVAPSAQITVYEDARLTAGALSWDTSTATNERVYVEGDAALCCASLGGSWASHLHCRGNWVSNAAWAPGAGPVVHLDGSTSTTVEGLAPSFDPRFATLLIESGERVSAGDFDLQATSLTITSGAALRLDGQRVSLTVPSLQVQGALRVGAGSALELDATTQLTVAASGTLRCVGTTSSPAVVSGRSGGGYGLLVSGRLEAMNFVFAQMGVAGIRVASSAVLAPAPEDLRSGVFREGSSTAGACLLDVARTSAVELRYLRFENAGTATYNLRSTTFAPIRLVNWSGAFSGPAFEDDPNGVIEWSAAEATELGAFASLGAVQSVGISFDTVSESEDVVAFHVLRAESPSGPFQELSGSPLTPIGGPTTPASYALSDTGLTEYTQYFYKLEEELSHGGRRELATDSARPWPASIGDTVFVGPNGYATPAAALVAVPSGGTIVIAGGTYPSFEIDRPVMLMPATSDPVVIDTASAPLVVRDVSSGLVALYGLRVGTGAGTRGVEVQRCDAVVVLDGLTIDADPARDALLLDACSRAAVQSCAIGAGAIGRARNATRAHWSAGSVGTLVLESGSAVDTCGVVPGSVVVNPGCTHRALPGTMPRVDMQLVGRSARTQRFRVTGDPFAPFTLYFALGDGYLDLSAVLPIDMVLLLDLGLMAPFASGSLSVSGEFELALPVPTEPLLWGYRLPFQALVLRGAALRFSNVRHMLFVP
jgi:hypothetical protein